MKHRNPAHPQTALHVTTYDQALAYAGAFAAGRVNLLVNMAKTSSAEARRGKCPWCGDSLAEDHAGRGFRRHRHRPDATTAARIASRRRGVCAADKEFLSRTGRCPWERGQRDGPGRA